MTTPNDGYVRVPIGVLEAFGAIADDAADDREEIGRDYPEMASETARIVRETRQMARKAYAAARGEAVDWS